MSPTHLAEAGAVFGLAAGDERGDAALAGEPAVFVVVVVTVGDKLVGAAAGRGRPRVPRTGGTRRVDGEMVFGAGSAFVDWARVRFGAPFFACRASRDRRAACGPGSETAVSASAAAARSAPTTDPAHPTASK